MGTLVPLQSAKHNPTTYLTRGAMWSF